MHENYVQQLKKGSLEMVLLSILAEGQANYGYEIITLLHLKGGAFFRNAREGTIYPVLYRLEEDGLLQTQRRPSQSGGPPRKCYQVTERGKTVLHELAALWNDYTDTIRQLMGQGKEPTKNET